jgi:hypothetical protein
VRNVDGPSYFQRLGGDRFRPTHHTAGAWTPSEQHFAPLAGLLAHEIERHVALRGADDLLTARLAFDILGTVAIEELDVRVEALRTGRTIELLEVVGSAGGRPFARGRAWRLIERDTSAIAGGEPGRLSPPDTVGRWPMSEVWPGEFIAGLDVRPIDGPHAGRAIAWVRSPIGLVEGEETSDLARFVALVDVANGIAVRHPPGELFYPNVDLAIHVYRQPTGEWVGLDTTVVFGPTGQGLTTTTLHDAEGPVGVALQTLTIRPHEPR